MIKIFLKIIQQKELKKRIKNLERLLLKLQEQKRMILKKRIHKNKHIKNLL